MTTIEKATAQLSDALDVASRARKELTQYEAMHGRAAANDSERTALIEAVDLALQEVSALSTALNALTLAQSNVTFQTLLETMTTPCVEDDGTKKRALLLNILM